jgi:hypothetical protein
MAYLLGKAGASVDKVEAVRWLRTCLKNRIAREVREKS